METATVLLDYIEYILEQEEIIDVAILVLGTYLALIWFGLIIWTVADAYRRSRNIFFLLISFMLAAVLNIFGMLIYLLIRPQQLLSQKDLESRELEQFIEKYFCPQCDRAISADFKFCPHCHTCIKKTCKKCRKLIDKTWYICPYCGTKTQKI